MSRATIAQLKILGIDSYAINQVADANKQASLDSASARIDSALATQFTMPIIEPYPMDIIECECVLASWTLLMAQSYNAAPGVDDNFKARYEYWENYLLRVSKGELVPQVVDSTSTDLTAGASGPSVVSASQRGYSERGIFPGVPIVPTSGPFSSD